MALPGLSPGNPAATFAALDQWRTTIDALVSDDQAAQQAILTLQLGLAAEIKARADAINAGDMAEAAARQQAINAIGATLQTSINVAAAQLQRNIEIVSGAAVAGIGQEQQTRANAINALSQTLTSQITSLQALVAGKAAQADFAPVAAQAATLTATVALLNNWASTRRFELLPTPGRPGDAPSRFTLVSAASALAGPRSALPEVPARLLANGDSGPAVRLLGSGILAARNAFPIETGRLYRARYVVQRRSDPADPSGDAVICGVVYLDQSLRVLGDVVTIKDYPTLTTSYGRQQCEALIAGSANLGAAFQAPALARFVVPLVQTFGPDALTDAEVIEFEDVTGAFVFDPPVADFEGRLSTIEAGDYGTRLAVVESEVGTPSNLTFRSKGDASAASIPASVQTVQLLGRGSAGDGGGGLYIRTAAQLPAGADSFSSGGAVFVRVVVAADVAAGVLSMGYQTWFDSLPTDPPDGSNQPWNNGNVLSWTP